MSTELLDREELQGAPLAAATGPLDILRIAVQQGADADAVEKIAAMIERRERWDAERAFNEAMCTCQSELPGVARTAFNKHTKSYYAKLEDVGRAIDPIIHRHGFSQSFGTEESHIQGWIRIVCDLRHSAGHCQRYKLDLPPDDKGLQGTPNKTPVQGVISTCSYGERSLTCLIFKVRLEGNDNDGNAAAPPITPDQVADINDLILNAAEAIAKNPADVLSKMLDAYQIKSLDELPAIHYSDARARLHRMISNASR